MISSRYALLQGFLIKPAICLLHDNLENSNRPLRLKQQNNFKIKPPKPKNYSIANALLLSMELKYIFPKGTNCRRVKKYYLRKLIFIFLFFVVF